MSLETVHKKTSGSLKRQYSKLTDLNLLTEESIKVAVDQFEPAILPWQAGMHPQDHKPGCLLSHFHILLIVNSE